MAKVGVRVIVENENDSDNDNDGEPVAAGSTLRGRIEVTARSPLKSATVGVELGWVTAEQRSAEVRPVRRTQIYCGPLSGASSHPFALTVPGGPITYHGKHIKLDWQLTGRVTVPLYLDSVDAVPITVAPGPVSYHAGRVPWPAAKQSVKEQIEDAMSGWFAALLGLLLTAGPLLISSGLEHPSSRLRVLWGAFCLLFVAVSLIIEIRRRIADQALGPRQLVLSPQPVAAGQTLQVRLRLQPHRATAIAGIKIRLTGAETVTRGDNEASWTETHVFYDQTIAAAAESQLPAGERFEPSASFELPATAPPSLRVPFNFIDWTITAEIARRDRAPLRLRTLVRVVPCGSATGGSSDGA